MYFSAKTVSKSDKIPTFDPEFQKRVSGKDKIVTT
jgi:hypothetical protein